MLPDAARPLSALAAAGLLLALSACGAGAAGSSDGRLSVVASFYPLQYAAEQVGGDLVRVSSLTKPGAEPHDLELTPRDIVRLTKADLVVYEKGFQPAVDDAVAQAAKGTALDVSAPAHLDLYSTETGHTDESAARKLGLSVRTIQRMMSELTGRLGAESRFQAGAEAVRRGWL